MFVKYLFHSAIWNNTLKIDNSTDKSSVIWWDFLFIWLRGDVQKRISKKEKEEDIQLTTIFGAETFLKQGDFSWNAKCILPQNIKKNTWISRVDDALPETKEYIVD